MSSHCHSEEEEEEGNYREGREEEKEGEAESRPDCWRRNHSEEAAVETVLRCRLNKKVYRYDLNILTFLPRQFIIGRQ